MKLSEERKAMKAQPGDKIIVTKQDCSYCGVTGSIRSRDEIFNRVWVFGTKGHGQFWLYDEHYEVLEDADIAEVGDNIILVSDSFGESRYKIFTIVKIDRSVAYTANPIIEKCNWLMPSEYKVLKRNIEAPVQICLDCNGTGQIQLFSSTVRCECNEKG